MKTPVVGPFLALLLACSICPLRAQYPLARLQESQAQQQKASHVSKSRPEIAAHPNPIPGCSALDLRFPDGRPLNLTGVWSANDQGVYYIRQIGDCVWWAGLFQDSGLRFGLTFTNVFRGRISSGLTIVGDWADVPRGTTLGSGSLTISVIAWESGGQDFVEMRKQAETGNQFGALTWRPTSTRYPYSGTCGFTDVLCKFGQVYKSTHGTIINRDGETLLDNLKPYKDNIVVFGTITRPLSNSYPEAAARDDCTFYTVGFGDASFESSDGDTDFQLAFDPSNQPGGSNFMTDEGWLHNRMDIQNLLGFQTQRGTRPPRLHPELIMFGKPVKRPACDDAVHPLLPGWMESGTNSILLNGHPLNGQIASGEADSIMGYRIPVGTKVRITGALVLDCGHFSTDVCESTDYDNGENVEIHPVYAMDILQPWNLPRSNAALTGVWSATDAGTYYVRQVGDTVWWLGLSADQGVTFANVFHGTIRGSAISGDWADVPMYDGGFRNSGKLTVAGMFCFQEPNVVDVTCQQGGAVGPSNFLATSDTDSAVFRNYHWTKLYDEPPAHSNITASFLTVRFADTADPDRTAKIRMTFGLNGQRVAFPTSSTREVNLNSLVTLPASVNIPLSVSSFGTIRLSVSAHDDNKPPCLAARGQPCTSPHLDLAYDAISNFGQGAHTETSRDGDGETFQLTYRIDVR